MLKLNAHRSNREESHHVSFSLLKAKKSVEVSFKIESKEAILMSDKYVSSFKNWSLWDHDVFELFLSFNKKEYIEIQVSPLNQKFILVITKPREAFAYPEFSSITSTTWTDETNWGGTISIPLGEIPGDANELYGNVCSCLGAPKSYFALKTNDENRADFHRPDLFSCLGEL